MPTFALVMAGSIAAYFSLVYMLRRRSEELRRETRDQINLLHARIRLLDRAVAARQAGATAVLPGPSIESQIPAAKRATPLAWPQPAAVSSASQDLPPETMALISETVSGFLGKNVRVHSARKLPTPQAVTAEAALESVDSWSQQGRVLVQTSHAFVHARILVPPAPPATNSLRGVVFENTDIN